MSDDTTRRLIDRIHDADKLIWVFCGDSITHGALHTAGARDYVELVEERVRYELGKALHLFANSGISGDTTAGILKTLDHRVLQFRPDIFSLMIGMNDAARLSLEDYEKNLREIVQRVRAETNAEALLQTCCAIDPDECPGRERYADYMAACRRVAADLNTALIDHHSTWESVRVEDRDTFKSWMANEFHPNALGHWVFAERILKDLRLGGLEKTSPPS